MHTSLTTTKVKSLLIELGANKDHYIPTRVVRLVADNVMHFRGISYWELRYPKSVIKAAIESVKDVSPDKIVDEFARSLLQLPKAA